jgi:hypothetical protein
MVIDPSAVPKGTGVQLRASVPTPPGEGYVEAPILVYASPRCTGT